MTCWPSVIFITTLYCRHFCHACTNVVKSAIKLRSPQSRGTKIMFSNVQTGLKEVCFVVVSVHFSSGSSKPVDCVTVTITHFRGKSVKTAFMFWARNGWDFKCPSQIFDILYFNNHTFIQYKNYCLIRCSRTCFFGIKSSKFQVKVKTVEVATFVDGIFRLKLFIFVLFLHFLVLKINKYCRRKDGCYAIASICWQASANMHDFSVHFQFSWGPNPVFHILLDISKRKTLWEV